MKAIGAQDAYARGITGQDVVIGVVDTGFTPGGPYLDGKVVAHRNHVENSQENSPNGDYFHGDETSMVIAGNIDLGWKTIGFTGGIAPDAKISQAHIFDTGRKMVTYAVFDDVYANILSDGGTIANHSVTNGQTYLGRGQAPTAQLKLLSEIVSKYVDEHDMLMVFAAGNSSLAHPSDFGAMQVLDARLQTAGMLTAVALDDTGNLRSYSTKCGIVAKWCLGAPVNINMPKHASDPTPVVFGGTSTAAPVISSTAALVKQAFPYLKGDQIGQVLLGTARDLGDPGVDVVYGYGMLDAAKAIRGPGKFDWGDFEVDFKGGSVWQNAISGDGGLIKKGSGILRLTEFNSYLGGTRIEKGAVVVNGANGAIGDVQVLANGILAGDGHVGDVVSPGIVHAGWPYSGTLTVMGDYTNNGGALSVVLGSNLEVQGTAKINGGLLAIDGVENAYVRTGSTSVLHAGAGVVGDFDDFELRSSYLVDGKYEIQDHDVVVSYDVDTMAGASVYGSANACQSATLIENSVATTSVKTGETTVVRASNDLIKIGAGIQMLATSEEVRDALREVSGHLHPSVNLTASEDSRGSLQVFPAAPPSRFLSQVAP